jgi:hypothetical protein
MFALVQNSDDAAAMAEALQRAHPEWWVADTVLGAA